MHANRLHTVSAAAALAGLPRQTVVDAALRGAIRCWKTACGLPLVRLADVQAFAENRPVRGRPKRRKHCTKT